MRRKGGLLCLLVMWTTVLLDKHSLLAMSVQTAELAPGGGDVPTGKEAGGTNRGELRSRRSRRDILLMEDYDDYTRDTCGTPPKFCGPTYGCPIEVCHCRFYNPATPYICDRPR